MHSALPMKGLQRNDDAMKNPDSYRDWYQKNNYSHNVKELI